jgi:8-oxo-dGTP diphosphatase
MVQLRAHSLADGDYARLAERAFTLCEHAGAFLTLNRDPARVRDLPCHGLHLTGNRLAATGSRPPGNWEWVSASCHCAAELTRAAELGLDYALLSPVLRTASHPDASPLGWNAFAAMADSALLPVYALGGVGPKDLDKAVASGAQGIAAIRGLWPHSSSANRCLARTMRLPKAL